MSCSVDVKTNSNPTSIAAYNFIPQTNSMKFIERGYQDLTNPRLLFSFADRKGHVHRTTGRVMHSRETISISELMSYRGNLGVKDLISLGNS